MTEFEINKAVAEKLGVDDDYGTFTPLLKYSFDPCNNVSQAWAIMMKYGISVTPNGDGMYVSFRVASLFEGIINYYENKVIIHKKPLVAAMLVFLEI